MINPPPPRVGNYRVPVVCDLPLLRVTPWVAPDADVDYSSAASLDLVRADSMHVLWILEGAHQYAYVGSWLPNFFIRPPKAW